MSVRSCHVAVSVLVMPFMLMVDVDTIDSVICVAIRFYIRTVENDGIQIECI